MASLKGGNIHVLSLWGTSGKGKEMEPSFILVVDSLFVEQELRL